MNPTQIRRLQTLLKAAGFDPGAIDGAWGPRTDAAMNGALAALAAKPGVPCPADMDPVFFRDMAADLEQDEGRREYAYKDSEGYLTIGVGRLIDKRKGGRLTDAEIDYLLANDIRKRWDFLEARVPAWQSVKGDRVRMRGLLNMAFQLGEAGLLDFHTSLGHIKAKDWAGAGRALRRSLWYRQTPNRAERVIRMIERGER